MGGECEWLENIKNKVNSEIVLNGDQILSWQGASRLAISSRLY